MIFIIFRFRRSSVPQVSFAIISNPSPFVNPIFSSFLSFLLPFFNTPGCCFCPLVFSCLFSSVPPLYILRWGWGWALYMEIEVIYFIFFRIFSICMWFKQRTYILSLFTLIYMFRKKFWIYIFCLHIIFFLHQILNLLFIPSVSSFLLDTSPCNKWRLNWFLQTLKYLRLKSKFQRSRYK